MRHPQSWLWNLGVVLPCAIFSAILIVLLGIIELLGWLFWYGPRDLMLGFKRWCQSWEIGVDEP